MVLRLNCGNGHAARWRRALTMGNPVLVEAVRGALVESRHRGAVAVGDAGGALVLALGDVERPVYPRSAIKALQALPLIESGAADRFGSARRNWRWPAPRTAASRPMSRPRTRMLARGGARRRRR